MVQFERRQPNGNWRLARRLLRMTRDLVVGKVRATSSVDRRLKAIRATDERLAASVYTTLLYGGSAEARMLTDGAGRDAVRLFVCQIIGTLRSMNC